MYALPGSPYPAIKKYRLALAEVGPGGVHRALPPPALAVALRAARSGGAVLSSSGVGAKWHTNSCARPTMMP